MAESERLLQWEQEIAYPHRWGDEFWAEQGIPNRGEEEHARLRSLWDAAQPLSVEDLAIARQITALEICNYRLEESILAICRGIGAHRNPDWAIGHWASLTEERWKAVWAYALALRDWLPSSTFGDPSRKRTGYAPALNWCDADGAIRSHVHEMLGDSTPAKEMWVCLFATRLEWWIAGEPSKETPQGMAYESTYNSLIEKLRPHDPDERTLRALRSNLQPCHCKYQRRLDIIISSIGAGAWRAAIPVQGTGRQERYALLDGYLDPIQAWLDGSAELAGHPDPALIERIQSSLGTPDPAKRFLASLLVSLLRSQQREPKLAQGSIARQRK